MKMYKLRFKFYERCHIVMIVCVVILLLSIGAYAEMSPEREKFRAAYLHLAAPEKAEERLRELASHGLNAALIADGSFQIDEERWRVWGELAAEYNIRLFPILHFAVPRQFKDGQSRYQPYVTRQGVIYQATPSPLDAAYWDTVIAKRFERLAELSKTTPISGILFDAELYGSDISIYRDLCFSDLAWDTFTRALPNLFLRPSKHRKARFLPKEERFDYLIRHDLFREYTRIQWRALRNIVARIEARLHRINPQLSLGFLCYQPIWSFSALVHGLGTPQRPALVFTESSYVRGYTPYVDQERDDVLANTPHARYIPGLWLNRFFPEDLPIQLRDLAAHSDGYWIYTADRLWADARIPKTHPLHGSKESYWGGVVRANEALIRQGADEMRAVRQSSFYDSRQRHLSRTPALRRLLSQHVSAAAHREQDRAFVGDTITYRGDPLFHWLASPNSVLRIRHVPLDKDTLPEIIRLAGDSSSPVTFRIFDDQGQIVQEGRVGPEHPVMTITLPVNERGLMSLLLLTGVNAARVEFSGIAWVVEASSTFPFETFRTAHRYTFRMAEEQALKIRTHCPPGEVAEMTIQPPNQTAAEHTATGGFSEFSLDFGALETAEAWSLTTSPLADQPFGDLRMYLYDAALPYLMPDKNPPLQKGGDSNLTK